MGIESLLLRALGRPDGGATSQMCRDHGLVATGGSDFHGPRVRAGSLGIPSIPMAVWDALQAPRPPRRGRRAATADGAGLAPARNPPHTRVIRALVAMVSGPFARAMLAAFFFFGSLNGFVLLPLYIHQLGGTEASIGLVQGIYSATGIVCQPLVGAWIDRLGRRTFMLLGTSVLTVATAAFIVTSSIPGLAVLRARARHRLLRLLRRQLPVRRGPRPRRAPRLGARHLRPLRAHLHLARAALRRVPRAPLGLQRPLRVLDPPRGGGDRGRRAHARRPAPDPRRRHDRRRVPRQRARAVAAAHGPDVLLRPRHGDDLHVPADVRRAPRACAASGSSTPPMRWRRCSCASSGDSSSTCAGRAP